MRGMGSVYQRGHVWWVQYSFNGRKHRESTRSRNRRDAVRLLRSRLEEIGRGRLIGPALEKTTFDDLAELLLTDYRINRKRSLARITADRANEILLRATRSSFRSMCASALKGRCSHQTPARRPLSLPPEAGMFARWPNQGRLEGR